MHPYLLFLYEVSHVDSLVMGGYSHELYEICEVLVIIELVVKLEQVKWTNSR